MAHYAKILDGKVVEVKTADEDFFTGFTDTSPGKWIETFRDRSQRDKYAGVGDLYNSDDDYFYPQSPYPSWTFNTTSKTWEAPVACPDSSDDSYVWNEETQTWDAVEAE